MKKLETLLWDRWSNEKNTDVLFPPFKVFSNTNFNDIERLRFIAKAESLPKNTKLRSYDFLRPDELREKTSYIATINNLGFRDPPRTIEKPKNVFRIIVLGTYSAFGHAVNDEDSYSRQLESILNNRHLNNMSFEVWNGGRQSTTAIVGLARLETEVLNYKPDLIIWDYGLVDMVVLGEDSLPFFNPSSGAYRSLVWFYRFIKNVTDLKSVALFEFEDYLKRKSFERNRTVFLKVNRKMMEFTKQKHVPVICLRQSVTTLSSSSYQRLANEFDNVIYIDGTKIFMRYPPPHELVKRFHSEENWISDYDPAIEKMYRWQPPEYFKDIFHYNEWGHKAIAEYLADTIEKNFSRFVHNNVGQKPAM